jgi:hypothetical protein
VTATDVVFLLAMGVGAASAFVFSVAVDWVGTGHGDQARQLIYTHDFAASQVLTQAGRAR